MKFRASQDVTNRVARVLGPAYRRARSIRESESRGCVFAERSDGVPVFVRWRARRDPGATEAILREYGALTEIADRGIPLGLDVTQDDELVALVMEYVTPAADSGAQGDPAWLAEQLVRVLRRSHAAGWTHNDIKPANLVRSVDGRLMVVDWELACRVGDVAPAGTLGWAPPEACEPGREASEWADFYSAAVVVWEAIHGRSAFTGTREDIARAQSGFRFDGMDSHESEHVRFLAQAARTRAWDGTAVMSTPCGDWDARRLLAGQSVRLHSDAEAAGAPHVRTTVESELEASSASCERAAAAEARSRGVALVVEFRVIQASAQPPQRAGRSRVLPVLQRWVKWLRKRGDARHVHVVACPSTPADRREFRSLCVAAPPGVRLEIVEQNVRKARSSRLVATRAAAVLALRATPRDLINLVAKASPRTLETATQLAFDSLVARAESATCERRPRRAARPARGSLPASPAEVAQAAREALRRGDMSLAYRLAVRVTTETLSAGNAPPSARPHLDLVDVWTELGDLQAARRVASMDDASSADAPTLVRLGRLAAAQRDNAELGSIVLRLAASATTPTERAAAARYRAVLALARADGAGALREMRAARADRRHSDVEMRIECAATIANGLRLVRRSGRATWLLRRVVEFARGAASRRLEIICESNLLLADRQRPAAARAAGWEAVGRMASSWRPTDVGLRALATAAHLWLDVGEYERARGVLNEARASHALIGLDAGSRELLTQAEVVCCDREERFPEMLAAAGRLARDPAARLRTVATRAEWRGSHGVGLLKETAGGRTSRIARGVRVLLSALARRCPPAGRARRTLSCALDAVGVSSGMCAHAARLGVRMSATLDAWLGVARVMATESRDDRQFALALHALALCHGGAVSGASRAWFVDEASLVDRDRPMGIREWEWRLAHDAARTSRPVRLRSEHGVNDFEQRIPAAFREEHRNWVAARFADDLADAPTGAEPPVRADASASARVLECAARLRSAGGLSEALNSILHGVLEVSRAERSVVIYESEKRPRARVGSLAGFADLDPEDSEVSRSVLARVRDAAGCVVLDDVSSESILGDRPSVRRYRPRAVMACALRTAGRYLGFIYAESRSRAGCFGPADAAALEAFSAQAALALENAALVEDLRESYSELSRVRNDAVRAESLRVLGRLASEVAHDLNNLLAAVLGEAQLLLLDPRYSSAYDSLRVIERAAQDGAECIRRIQASTRQDAVGEFAQVDLADVLREVVALTRGHAESRRDPDAVVQVRFEGPDQVLVRGSATELREVFTNLVVNAIDAMPSGGQVVVATGVRGGIVRASVSDTGVGMAPEVAARVFEPFFSTKGSKGNGLGLSIASGVIRRHGGRISVESKLGHGTRFDVELPKLRGDVASFVSAERYDDARAADATLSRSFLVVDDDPSVLRVLSAMLRQLGADVDESLGGAGAIARMAEAQGAYDCVVTDLYMPNVSGLDVAAEAQSRCPRAHVVLMSGCATTLMSAAADSRGRIATLSKPFSLEAIRRLVADVSGRASSSPDPSHRTSERIRSA